jgi:hypothetical protein
MFFLLNAIHMHSIYKPIGHWEHLVFTSLLSSGPGTIGHLQVY